MATRMNPVAGRFFNSPQFATAMSNLAGAFAPPSPQEYLIGEQLKRERQAASRLDELWAGAAGDPDRQAVLLDLYNPDQSYYATNQADATKRYGIDTGARTAITTNAADNARALEVAGINDATNRRGQDIDARVDLTTNAADNARALDVARIADATDRRGQNIGLIGDYATTPLERTEAIPGVPPEIAAALGLPALPSASGAALGAEAAPLSESEMKALILGDLSPADQRNAALSDVPVEQVVGPDGQPVFSTRMDAVGQQAYVPKGSEAKPTPITFERDGVRMGGFVVGDQYVDADGVPLSAVEAGTVAEIGKPTGSNADLGITNSNLTDYNRVQQTVVQSNMLIDQLEGLVKANAGAAGAAGSIQMLAQDFVQTGRELGEAFGLGPDGIVTPDMLNAIGGSGDYNPVFRQIRAGMLQLAYLNAQRDNPRGEVSRFALERQIDALGQGLVGNDQSVLASLAMSRDANARSLAAAEALVGRAAVSGIPTISSPEEAMQLPSGTLFYDPQGVLRQVP